MSTATSVPASDLGKLWMVHILGPDDIYAAPSLVDAYEQAAKLLRFFNTLPKNEYSPTMSAAVVEWDGTPEAHARNLATYWEDFSAPESADTFQRRNQAWLLRCFGEAIAADKTERNHRFFEEATEAVQANGMTRSEAHQLVDCTFDRPVGELQQEVGGVMVTLAAMCSSSDVDMHRAGEIELARISDPATMAKIRAKQAAKPKHSPLPEAAAAAPNPSNLSSSWIHGIERAALFIEKKRDDYVGEHGIYDRETGATEYPGNGLEYVTLLDELADDIRALSDTPVLVAFANNGEEPDYSDLDCPYCHGSGHKGDIAAPAQGEEAKTVAWLFEMRPANQPHASWRKEVLFYPPTPAENIRNVIPLGPVTAEPDKSKDAPIRPTELGIYAWVSTGVAALVLVNKRPSDHSPGGVLNGHIINSTKFYDGCAVEKWAGGSWFGPFDAALQAAATKEGV